MNKNIVIKAENISKQYRLGQVGTGTISHDLNRFWHKIRGKEDPYLKIGEANDRTSKGESDYVWSLQDINFEIEQGDAVGIIGRNGAGKSTLLKILSRVTKPTTGKIYTKGRIASLLEVGTGFHPEMTGRENIYLNGAILGMTRKEITRKFDEIVDFSGVERYVDTPVKRYSSGMYVRLAFAVAAHLESEILIVDEVLAVGDAEFQKKCLGKMGDVSKGEGRTVLFVSHNMAAVKELCKNGIFLDKGRINKIGNISTVISEYLKDYKITNNKKFSNSPLKYIEFKQEGEDIMINAEYDCNKNIDIPNLGFVIFDKFGDAILGANPVLSLMKTNNYKSGQITARIKDPRLIDGRYTVSIWFGDSHKVFFHVEDCIGFEIKDMVKIAYINTSHIGSVFPKMEWEFK